MDDVIERVRKYAENLANNGAPHQTGIGRDILKVVDLVDVTNAKAAVTDAAAIAAASVAKALQDELSETKGLVGDLQAQLDDALEENKRLTQAVAEAAAENVRLLAEIAHIGELPVNKLDGGDGVALTSTSHEQFGTGIDEVVGKMQAGGIMGPNGEVLKAKTDKHKKA